VTPVPPVPPEHFRRLHEYELWANARVNASLRSARDHLEHGGAAAEAPALIKALQIWAHVQWARKMWLSRLGAGEPPSLDEGMFPTRSLEAVIGECAEMDERWGAYVSRLTPELLASVCRYTSTEGVAYDTVVSDILTHVVNHSTYHRGQIARLVAECGGAVAVTDYIAFARTRPS
jgi:uncharacterized damage-inducible protein DinB